MPDITIPQLQAISAQAVKKRVYVNDGISLQYADNPYDFDQLHHHIQAPA